MPGKREGVPSPKPDASDWEAMYDRWADEYSGEVDRLEAAGWRSSTDAPGRRVGQPGLEEDALDQETRQPLPDGSRQTAIEVKNEPVGWGDCSWFVKDGEHEAPGPGYDVIVREAKSGKWVGIEGDEESTDE